MDRADILENHIYDVSGDWPGSVFLAAGKTNILFDAGVACCADALTAHIESALQGGNLDYVFLTHSHFDHVSGVPAIRKKWPDVRVLIAPHGKNVLDRPSTLRRIREMNEAAARDHGVSGLHYRDEDLYADDVLTDGQVFLLDEWSITAVETPGHTRDCFSFLIEREGCAQKILVCAETAGVYAGDRGFSPCFLLGYEMAAASMEKMRSIGADRLIFAHAGFAPEDHAEDTWMHCLAEHELAVQRIRAEAGREIPLEDKIRNLSNDYWPEELRKYQPYAAYAVNMKSMLETITQRS